MLPGLNVEQRKRLTIGVELAAKPQLLLFLDEPTSGLDSQTSWSILDLLEKLKNNGQAILCTIHQPSAMLFQRFDRLLFLARGGRTVYFGPVGESSRDMIRYFEKNGAHNCPSGSNPAEWMLEVIGAAPGSHTDIDWVQVWKDSPEIRAVHAELEQMKNERSQLPVSETDKSSYRQFAAPFLKQYVEVQKRVFQQYWRTPSYIYAKISLCVLIVSLKGIPVALLCHTDTFPGSLRRLLLLPRTKHSTRPAEPAFRDLHAAHHLLSVGPANHASLRHATLAV